MQEVYGIAAFRSRQQVLRFEDVLRREGVNLCSLAIVNSIENGKIQLADD